MSVFTRAALVVGFAVLAAPTAAFAGDASIGADGVPRYDAAPGEINNVTIAELPGIPGLTKSVVFQDTVPVDPNNCVAQGAFAARCEMPIGNGFVRVRLQDRNDRLAPATVNAPTTIGLSSQGDGGDDTMTGTRSHDALDGSAGDDTVNGGGGDDNLEGSGGDDTIIGGTGRDDMFGNTGSDVLNADDNAGGDSLDCGSSLFAWDLAIYNAGDTVSSNCEETRQG